MPERLEAPTKGVGLPNGVHSSITPSTLRDVRGAVECWQPDVGCIAAGDRHIELAVRCWAAAMLSDYQISKRLRDFAVGVCPALRQVRRTSSGSHCVAGRVGQGARLARW